MGWICAEHSGGDPEMVLLLSSTDPEPVLVLVLPHWGGDWGAWKAGRIQQDR